MIRFEAVSKEFDGARALDNLTFETLAAGRFLTAADTDYTNDCIF